MKIINTDIPGLLIFEPKIFGDERGCFFDSYDEKIFKSAGINRIFVRDSQTESSLKVLRGLHYQLQPFALAKLVRVVKGKVLDVAVDIRKGSPTFGKWESVELSEENRKQFFVPRGFAHGYLVLSEKAVLLYKFDNYYYPEHEAGIVFDDKDLNIDWQVDLKEVVLSERDKNHSSFKDAKNNFVYGKDL
ncbi:MAG: dTDP-4-dehydrorhamnose 3,5-epimerase [Candidatus Omnitrophica bacterium]|nr:dTDP-4-dehydrorhamnose 3,5-epimerase [Candidatus Omnitrophota bacterium]